MSCSDENSDECASAPISTCTGGAPNRPSASGSQPARLSSVPVRAAARQMPLATVAPVRKADGAFARQVEQLEQPALGDRLDRGRRRRRRVEAGVLAPGRDQEIGRDAGRMRRAHHPAEKARAGDRHQRRLRAARTSSSMIASASAPVSGTGAARALEHAGVVDAQRRRIGRDRLAIVGGVGGGAARTARGIRSSERSSDLRRTQSSARLNRA